MFESKRGFHPCNFEDFKKIKLLYKYYWRAKIASAAWNRWSRKLPKNRVVKRKIPGKGYEVLGPMTEPFFPKSYQKLLERPIIPLFQQARHPQPTKNMLKPLVVPLSQVEELLKSLEEIQENSEFIP